MGKYVCEKCLKDFRQKSHYDRHIQNRRPCQNISKMMCDLLNQSEESLKFID